MIPGGSSSTWWVTSTEAGASGSSANPGQPPQQVLAAAEVHARGRLVEQQQLRIGHQRPRDLHPGPLALAQRAVGALGQAADAERPSSRPARRMSRRP